MHLVLIKTGRGATTQEPIFIIWETAVVKARNKLQSKWNFSGPEYGYHLSPECSSRTDARGPNMHTCVLGWEWLGEDNALCYPEERLKGSVHSSPIPFYSQLQEKENKNQKQQQQKKKKPTKLLPINPPDFNFCLLADDCCEQVVADRRGEREIRQACWHKCHCI